MPRWGGPLNTRKNADADVFGAWDRGEESCGVRKSRAEAGSDAVGIFDLEMNPRLRGDQLPDARIAKDLPELRIVCAFDDKIAVKIWMPDLHVLHAQLCAEFGKNSLPIDGKAKTARIQKRHPHAGVVVLPVFVQSDEPAGVGRLDFTALPKIAIDIVGIEFPRQLPPNFVAAWP